MSGINFENVGVTFLSNGMELRALTSINLAIKECGFVALLGPTGCGKSTLLRVVSDLIHATTGTVTVRGASAYEARIANQFGFVFQEPALLPWRTALRNVQLPLEVLSYPRDSRIERCEALLDMVGLLPFRNHYPRELSGGMKQRIALIRALAWNPPILLMDEPFSSLDEITKSQLQDELLSIWENEKKTILFVTHNISEAVYLADEVVVMSAHPGRICANIKIDLPRPRTPEIRETIEFLDHIKRARLALTLHAGKSVQ
jgi:NitT/TauT family transport system ATP-binding protein